MHLRRHLEAVARIRLEQWSPLNVAVFSKKAFFRGNLRCAYVVSVSIANEEELRSRGGEEANNASLSNAFQALHKEEGPYHYA